MHINKGHKYFIFIIFVSFFIILLRWFLVSNKEKTIPPHQEAQGVLVSSVKKIIWKPSYHTVGDFSAIQGITITSQVASRVAKVLFTPGVKVKKGQVLITLEDGDLMAQLEQKKAQLELVKLNYWRYKQLSSKNFASNAQVDEMKSKYEESLADVKQIQEELKHYIIKAPFSGVIGLSNLSEGELIQPGDVITHLQEFDPIYLNFTVPQNYISQNLVGKIVEAKISVGGEHRIVSGKVVSIDSQLDENSRTIKVRAVFDNKKSIIMPGMFAELNVPLENEHTVLSIPASALVQTIYGNFVFKVVKLTNNQYKVIQTSVTKKGKVGSNIIINCQHEQCLKPGDIIVRMGGFKLMNNEPIRILTNLGE